MIKMAVFDLDGTLVDSLTDLANSVNRGLKAAGLPEQPVERFRKFVGDGRAMMVRRAVAAGGGSEESVQAVIDVFNDVYKRHCNDNTAAYDGCAEMLERLAANGVITAVLSNKPDEFVGRILQKVYPRHRFTEAWGQKPQYKIKPDGEALHAIMALHGVLPEECVYIGDSNVDVYTAQNGGVKMAGVSWGFRGKQELLDAGAPVVADTAEELTEILLNL